MDDNCEFVNMKGVFFLKKTFIVALVVELTILYLVMWCAIRKQDRQVAELQERVAITTQQCNNATELANQWRNQYNELLLEYAELKGENEALTTKVRQYGGAIYNQKAWVNAGQFTITHYCRCEGCCGKSDGITATGVIVEEGRTIAVDPKIIPLGSEVLIGGHVYIAEDTGVKGNHIDIYTPSHEQALQMGKYTTNIVWR